MKRSLLIIAPLLLLAGCYKESLNKARRLHGAKWSGTYALAAINADLNLDDAVTIVSGASNTGYYPDDLLYVVYEETEVSKFGNELFPLSGQNGNTSSALTGAEQTTLIGAGSVGINRSFIFPFVMSGIPELDSLYFSKGNFALNFQNNYDHPCTGSILVTDLRKPGGLAKYDFTVAARNSFNAAENLTGLIMDLTKGGTGYNELRINLSITYTYSGNPINLGDNFSLTYDFNTLEFQKMYGYFGTFNILNAYDSMELSIYNNGLKFGSFSFEDPRLKLKYSHNIGMPFQIQTNGLYGFKSGNTDPINGYPPNTPVPGISYGNEGSIFGDSIVLTHPSSNIKSVVDGEPTHILYDFDVQANPTGPVSRNFITAQSQFKVTVSLELPFNGIAAKVQLADTTDFNLNIGKASEVIDWLNFRVSVTNELPLTLGFQAYFMDTFNNILDSLFEPFRYIAAAATVDNSGNVISSTSDQYDVVFEKDKIQRIENAKRLMFRAFLNTAEVSGNQIPVRITRNQHFKIKLGVHTKLSIDEKI